MTSFIDELISIAGVALCDEPPQATHEFLETVSGLRDQLFYLLSHRNGFYAFESALHIFPAGCKDTHLDLENWNHPNGWRKYYDEIAKGCIFFAEDIFGGQYGLNMQGVIKFDPESGKIKPFTLDINEWASRILGDYEYETGYPLAHKWQKEYGPLQLGKRLVPKIPFIFGGMYSVDNLYSCDALQAMRVRADIWRQIRNLPDGARITFRTIKKSP